MLSLSYTFKDSKNFKSPSIFCDGPQKSSTMRPEPEGSGFLSGFIPFIIQTASMTSFTAAGGFYKQKYHMSLTPILN